MLTGSGQLHQPIDELRKALDCVACPLDHCDRHLFGDLGVVITEQRQVLGDRVGGATDVTCEVLVVQRQVV